MEIITTLLTILLSTLSLSGVFLNNYLSKLIIKESEQIAQIDLLIDRNDHVINLFEIKFYNEPFTITKAYAMSLRTKMAVFRAATQTRKQLFWVFITSFGLVTNSHSLSLNAQSLTLEDLFIE